MKIMSIDNNYNKPQFQALKVSVESLESIKKSGPSLVNRLTTAGKKFKEYKHFDLKIVDEAMRPVIESKDGKTVYQDFFRAVIPYGDVLNISTKFGAGEYKGEIRQFSLQYLNKSEAIRAYSTVHNDTNKDTIDFAIAITELLEKDALAKEEVYKQTDTSALFEFLDTNL